jgi:hypothetical protein
VLARAGEYRRAQEFVDAGVNKAAATDFLLLHADALADRADVHAVSGRTTAAAEDLERAIALYDQKGARSGGDAARRSRESLAGSRSPM